MIAVYKYEIPMADKFKLSMPENSKILTVQMHFGQPVLWAWVDTEKSIEEREFLLVGTGHPFPKKFECLYGGTFQMGAFVRHLFESLEAQE